MSCPTWIRYSDCCIVIVLATLHFFPSNVACFQQTKMEKIIAPWRAEWTSFCKISSCSKNYRYITENTSWYSGASCYASRTATAGSNKKNRLPTLARTVTRKDETNNDINDAITKSTSPTDFWISQKELVDNYKKEEIALKTQQTQAFQKRRLALVSDTIFFTILIFSIIWFLSETPQMALSYLFGATLSVGYSYGLGKYVESLGTKDNNSEVTAVQQQPTGDFGQARFALIFILLIALAKFRGQTGLQEIPTIAGFFTYQLATLNQGLKDLDEPV